MYSGRFGIETSCWWIICKAKLSKMHQLRLLIKFVEWYITTHCRKFSGTGGGFIPSAFIGRDSTYVIRLNMAKKPLTT